MKLSLIVYYDKGWHYLTEKEKKRKTAASNRFNSDLLNSAPAKNDLYYITNIIISSLTLPSSSSLGDFSDQRKQNKCW